MNTVNFQAPPDYSAEEAQIERQRKMAEALLAQSSQPMQGRMVGRVYVAPTWAEGLSKMGQALIGRKDASMADDREKAIKDDKNKRLSEWLAGMPKSGETTTPFKAQTFDETDTVPGVFNAQQTNPTAEDYMQWGMNGMRLDPQMAAAGMKYGDIIEGRETRKQEQEASRLARAEQDRMRSQDRRDMFTMQQQGREDIARLGASLRQSPAPTIATIMMNGRPTVVDARTGSVIGEAAPKDPLVQIGARKLTPTEQKELFDTQDTAGAASSVMGSIQKALELNDQTYSGIGADKRAWLASNLGLGGKEADNTVIMNNIVLEQALGQLKSTFGSAPTEGERKILIDLQASVNKTPDQRKAILERALQAAKIKMESANQRARGIQTGDYAIPGYGEVREPTPQLPSTLPGMDAIQAEIARRQKGGQ